MNLATDPPESRVKQVARKAKKALRKKNIESLAASLRPSADRPTIGTLTVLGPYRNRDKWRLVLIEGSERKSICATSREDALALKEKLTRDQERSQTQTVGTLLQQYRDYLRNVRGVLPSTAEHEVASLAGWLPLSLLATSLTPERAERLYSELTQTVSQKTGKPLAAATHQFYLQLAKSFCQWAQKERHLHRNPFAEVAPAGKRRTGKTQLRIDEARQFSQTAEAMADAGDPLALGVLLMLHLGLRQGEVGARVARDLDASGTILWIPAGKTKNAVRRLKVPESLRGPLLALARSKQPTGLLFTEGDAPPRHQYFWRKVHEVCARAGVPTVCPHSLRGLHATLALEAGATSSMVAKALGHGNFGITARHYASPDSVEGARVARVEEVLAQGAVAKKEAEADDPIAQALATLTPAQLAELKSRLK